MWLFLIHVFIVIVLWVIFIIAKSKRKYKITDWLDIFVILFSLILFGHICWIGIKQINPEKQLLNLQVKRDAIIYEIDNGILAGETLVDFNTNLAEDKWKNASPWFNWYVCDVVDEVDLIETK